MFPTEVDGGFSIELPEMELLALVEINPTLGVQNHKLPGLVNSQPTQCLLWALIIMMPAAISLLCDMR